MRRLLVLSAVGLTACGGGGNPNRPSPTPSPVTPVTISGQLRATNSGQPIAGATIQVPSGSATTNADGRFTLSVFPAAAIHARITGPLVDREVNLQARKGREVAIEGFTEGPAFDLAYYRQIVRGAVNFPGEPLQPIRRWTQAPRIYLRTVDEAGAPIDPKTLDMVATVIEATTPAWTGGAFGIAGLERGAETREGQAGWITVKWMAEDPTSCGRANVGLSGGMIELSVGKRFCECGGFQTAPRTVKHELGHAFGLWHSADPADLMHVPPPPQCDRNLSAREQQYARYLYARPVGNTDPDIDPIGTVLLQPVTVH